MRYPHRETGLLVIDPYNDFMSAGGKLYQATLQTATQTGLYANLPRVIGACRRQGIGIFIIPHRRWRSGDYQGWDHLNHSQQGVNDMRLFEAGSWGGEFHPDFGPRPGDVLVHEHWGQSGFANTDLDMQLKQRGILRIILVGLVANTCVESTGRFGVELGYHVTLVKDATAAFDPAALHAAHEINGPTFAHAIVTTDELLAALEA